MPNNRLYYHIVMEKINEIKAHIFNISILAIITISLRIPFQSKALFNWDSINFAYGVIDYNIVKHRPHPPGYFLYVYTARLLTGLTQDINTSYVIISILSGSLAAIFIYLFTSKRFNKYYGLLSAILIITNPLVWFYDEVALSYSFELLTSIFIGYSCYRAIIGTLRWSYIAIIFFCIACGFRQTVFIYFLPILIYSTWRIQVKHKILLTSIALCILLSWAIPMVNLTGGLHAYFIALQQLSSRVTPSPFNDFLKPFLYAGHLPLVVVAIYSLNIIRVNPIQIKPWERWFNILWILPGTFIILTQHIGQSGYILFLLPPIFIYFPPILNSFIKLIENRNEKQEINNSSTHIKINLFIITMIIINLIVFFFGGHQIITLQNQRWANIDHLTSKYPPQTTIVLTALERDVGIRHAGYYLPAYHVYGFFTTDIPGPVGFPNSNKYILGWIFHSYQYNDNFSLFQEANTINTILKIPPNTRGFLIPSYTMLDNIKISSNLSEDYITPDIELIDNWLGYIALPHNVSSLDILDGTIVIKINDVRK